jgi:hypothetical protein
MPSRRTRARGSRCRRSSRLPAGPAELVVATIPAGEGLTNGVELYLIPHGKHLYELSFQIDARFLRQAAILASIAQHFRFA